ncbi:hypothetical protein QBL02_03945 [Leucobacter sp. UT-8R-CII-1-4]|uniref:hypothetical protein n=1 Tax=Leucobacter sp. UT-8R-CII-1-4 TaxID=3040075 RepID=UPI0024A8CFC9|nr:hypothetical protein [Leucobacter sp. UT-8R-CII-1-4]MDI6022692.1 hypothetical protein [Leucobacter sp. UT-8R-CII-1-4]
MKMNMRRDAQQTFSASQRRQHLLENSAASAETPVRRSGLAKRVLAAVATIAMSIGLVSVTGAAAHADTAGIEIAVLHNGSVVSGAEVRPGDKLTVRVQYDAAQEIAGKQITFTLPKHVTVSGSLPTNDAIESAVQNDDGTFTVTFKNPIPELITEGAFAIQLVAGEVDGPTLTPITWKIGDDEGGVMIIIADDVTPPEVIADGYSKSAQPGNLDGFVTTSGSPDYAFTGLKPEIADQLITYTLVMTSADKRESYSIADALSAEMGYVTESFAAELTTIEGTTPFAFEPNVTGNTFAGTVDVPAQSTLRITYQAKVTDVAALEAKLKEQWQKRNDAPGNYEVLLPNLAVFGDEHERTANVRVRGNIPGVGVGNNFAKSGNWTLRSVVADKSGALQPPAEMTYTLRADLTPWDARNANFTLTQNVVIRDTLLDQASWQSGADFITISGDAPFASLTEAKGFTGTVSEFAASEYVGHYALNGQTLLVNVGDDNTTKIDIKVKAQLNTVAGLTANTDTTVVGGTKYPWPNRAEFHYRAGDPTTRDHNADVIVLPNDYTEGVNDSATFNKSALSPEVRVAPGESAKVPYRFEINTENPQVDPLKSSIVDDLNTEIFDVSDLDSIPVSGSYGGQPLNRSHFALSMNADGKLVIELSKAGKDLVKDLPKKQKWIIDIEFTTVPFTGKQTFEIYNRATLHSTDADWDYWSDDDSEATSYGDEAELRKRLFNESTGEWTAALNATIEDGKFVNERFVYSIELIPRGEYGRAFPVSVFTREDVLPASTEFLGFVGLDQNGVPDLNSLSSDAVDMKGNIVASYADGVVTIQQADGTSLDSNQGRIVTYFAVSANDASAPIVNTIAGSDAVITPVGDPSIDIEKWNDEGETPEYDASGAITNDGFKGDFDAAPGKKLDAGKKQELNFTVSNDGREDLINVVVSDKLVDGKGEIEDLVCTFPDDSTGTEWAGPFVIGEQFSCTGTLPALAAGQKHSDRATVTAVGVHTGIEVDDQDDWHGFTEAAPAGLVNTGASVPWLLGGVATLLVAAGSAALIARRRQHLA